VTELLEPFEDVGVEPEEFIETKDQVMVVVHVSGRGRGSGLPIDTTFAHLLTVRGGEEWSAFGPSLIERRP
jgi:ketosteroid isomerase-like protein